MSLTLLVGLPLALTAWGILYYIAPVSERVRDPLHALLRSSGFPGQRFGIIGLGCLLFIWLYRMHREFKWPGWSRSLSAWRNVQEVVGLALPVQVAVHAAWPFRGVIGLGYWSMLLVSLSGLAGCYLKSQVREIRPDVVLREVDRHPHIQPNDHVIVSTGGDSPSEFLKQLGVRIVWKERVLDAASGGRARDWEKTGDGGARAPRAAWAASSARRAADGTAHVPEDACPAREASRV